MEVCATHATLEMSAHALNGRGGGGGGGGGGAELSGDTVDTMNNIQLPLSRSRTHYLYVCMCVVSLVPGVDQIGETRRRPLASREIKPCCLLPQLWTGSSPGAGHWGVG